MNSQGLLVWLLRLVGVTEILAFIAVVMPRSWMEATHQWLGMGEMASGPLLMFMIRQASFTYGAHGVSLLVLASDVVRFRTLVVLNGLAYLLGGLVFFWIDYTSGMPWWWTIVDPAACIFTGASILLLSKTSVET